MAVPTSVISARFIIFFVLTLLTSFVCSQSCGAGYFLQYQWCGGFAGCVNRRLLQYQNEYTCVDCDPGFYCPGTDAREFCPSGFYCPDSRMTSGTQYPCTPSSRCPRSGMSEPDPFRCLAGQYLNATDSCVGCPIGHFCNGINKIQCFAGTFNNLTNQEVCPPCPAGYSCPNSTMTSVGSLCELGHLCTAGTATPKLCPAGFVCKTPSSYSNYSMFPPSMEMGMCFLRYSEILVNMAFYSARWHKNILRGTNSWMQESDRDSLRRNLTDFESRRHSTCPANIALVLPALEHRNKILRCKVSAATSWLDRNVSVDRL